MPALRLWTECPSWGTKHPLVREVLPGYPSLHREKMRQLSHTPDISGLAVTCSQEQPPARPQPVSTYICTLDKEKIAQLRAYLQERGYTFKEVKYAYFGASRNNVNITCYTNGRLLVQGKGTADFVRYYLEPQLLREIRFGYEYLLREGLPGDERIGVDESGKGDYFGPLVIAGVHADKTNLKELYDLNVVESKRISDKRALKLAALICSKFKNSIVIIGPEKYNMLYDKMSNLNRILAWGHARVVENLLAKVNCKKVIVDQFADKSALRNALMKKGRRIELEQRPRAEQDIVVAAASVVARGKFLSRLYRLSEVHHVELPKGASRKVIETGRQFIESRGIQQLAKVAKLHFSTTQKILGIEE
jgi:ribonuclease HIII